MNEGIAKGERRENEGKTKGKEMDIMFILELAKLVGP